VDDKSQLASGFDVYLDEAGNTGLRLDDTQQPVFVVAGWMVPGSSADEVASRVSWAVPSHLIKAQELKGSKLMRSREGQVALAELVTDLQTFGCVPTFCVAEKTYAIAGKLIESFLDPISNPLVPPSFVLDDLMKQDIAQSLCAQEEDDDLI